MLVETEASVKGDRVRKRGAPRDGPAEDDDALEGADLVEDGDGYLPEERADYGG